MNHKFIKYEAKPSSRSQLSEFAFKFREMFNLENEYYFPIIQFIEWLLPFIDKNFDLEIVENSAMPEGTYALTYPDESRMLIREDVYNGACENQGRARFTLAHELFHYLMHDSSNISFARQEQNPPAYSDPEWQANTFAAELLIPKHLIGRMSIKSIMNNCGVSRQCAEIQKNKYYKKELS